MRLLLAACLMLCAFIARADETALYVRGGFNGWGTAHALVRGDDGVETVEIEIGPGYHGFKLGRADWSQEWVAGLASIALQTDVPQVVTAQKGAELRLFVKTAGRYRFAFDRRGAAPALRVSRLADTAHAAADPHAGHTHVGQLQYRAWDGAPLLARFSSPDRRAALRTYVQSTTQPLRDPGPPFVRYSEQAGQPRVRSGSLAFDALFALAVAEMQANAVSAIRDGSYHGGQPVACDCFETGEQWHYVWTRDLSYAADLGLALLAPERVARSLLFKLSGYATAPGSRAANGGAQIVQDTGSGGSWPVSTDRVSWALGAASVLPLLEPAQRQAFARQAYAALRTTADNDRIAAFDPVDGLYGGEQSFLDWREQTYAPWITGDLASMASSKALSTNVAHLQALRFTAQLARAAGDAAGARKYAGWAAALQTAIRQRFWQSEAGLYSSMTAGHFDSAPLHRYDSLGLSLAILAGVADAGQALGMLSRYPVGPMGPPVVFPQQRDVPIYHNRAIWPFVTAYSLRAAAQVGHARAADSAYDSLVRGAALNLSNMENLEWLSGQGMLMLEQRPELSGPVINSRRQLWSVGAYIGMVVRQIFGVQVSEAGLAFKPMLTARVRRTLLAGADHAMLYDLRLRGKRVSVRLALPGTDVRDGHHTLRSVRLNGRPVRGVLGWHALRDGDRIDLGFGPLRPASAPLRMAGSDPHLDDATVYAPATPALRLAGDGVELTARSEPDVSYLLYRDGGLLPGKIAPGVTRLDTATAHCYSAEAVHGASGNRSHRSAPVCTASDTKALAAPLRNWGAPGEVYTGEWFTLASAGKRAVQLGYTNTANALNLGVSNGVKWLAVEDAAGNTVAQGVVQMPHTAPGAAPAYSTPLLWHAAPGRYRLRLADHYNMSYLTANAAYEGGGARNRIDLHAVRITTLH